MPRLYNEPKPIRDLALNVWHFNGHRFAMYAISDLLEYRFGPPEAKERTRQPAILSDSDAEFKSRRRARKRRNKAHTSRQYRFEQALSGVSLDITGAWAMGGAVLRLLGDGAIPGGVLGGDVDVFYRDRRIAEADMFKLNGRGFKRIAGGSIPTKDREEYEKQHGPFNPDSVRYRGVINGHEVTYNFALTSVYTRPEEATFSFDFRVTQMATDGIVVVAIDGAINDALNMSLVINRVTLKRRVAKYLQRGFILMDPKDGMRHDLNQFTEDEWPDEVAGVYRQFSSWAEMVGA